ncbi:MAG: glycosyltransferase family 2 protein, partial [Spirochaetota bacterium]
MQTMQNHKQDLVSIIMPVYNSEAYIRTTLDSVLSQSYTNWELWVADDLSQDSSRKIIQEYTGKDSRIKAIYKESNSGSADSRNQAIQKAEGRYISFLDSDDLWDYNFLEKQISYMQRNKAAFSCCSYRIIDENGDEILKPHIVTPELVDYHT